MITIRIIAITTMIILIFRIVSPYHCDTGIEVDCNDNSAVFAHCFPSALLPLFLDGDDGCDAHDDGFAFAVQKKELCADYEDPVVEI